MVSGFFIRHVFTHCPVHSMAPGLECSRHHSPSDGFCITKFTDGTRRVPATINSQPCRGPKSQSLTDVSRWDFKAWKHPEVNLGLVLAASFNQRSLPWRQLAMEFIEFSRQQTQQFFCTQRMQIPCEIQLTQNICKPTWAARTFS
jgi:hypothetical protein